MAAEITQDPPVQLRRYTIFPRLGVGRRLVSPLGLDLFEFHLPLFAHVSQGGDVDFVNYSVRYGPAPAKAWLSFVFGPTVGGTSPPDLENTSIKWTSRKLTCNESTVATDWRGSASDGRRWRHIDVIFGFAEYRDVPPKAADYFDKILNSVSCGKGP